MSSRSRSALIAALATLLCSTATAQVARSGGGNTAGAETARLQQQLQQSTAERAQLQAEVKRLQDELEVAKKTPAVAPAEAAALRQRAQVAEASVGRSHASVDEANAKAARAQQQYDELAAKYRETAKALRDIDGERTALEATSHRQHRDLRNCTDDNTQLIAMNEEIVGRLERTGFWTRAAADEPFLRLKRTELENLADSNRAAAAALKVATPTEPPPAKRVSAPAESTP
jgi:chromosome segregation ATPase